MFGPRTRSRATVVVLIGGALLLLGLLMGHQADGPATALCAGRVMTPNQDCWSSDPSRTGTYAELLARDEESDRAAGEKAPWLLGIGTTVAIVAASVGLADAARRSRRPAARAGAEPPAGWWSEAHDDGARDGGLG